MTATIESVTSVDKGPEAWAKRLQKAMAQVVEGRLWERIESGLQNYTYRRDGDAGSWTLYASRQGAADEQIRCTCPASTYGFPCKHVFALRVFLRSI